MTLDILIYKISKPTALLQEVPQKIKFENVLVPSMLCLNFWSLLGGVNEKCPAGMYCPKIMQSFSHKILIVATTTTTTTNTIDLRIDDFTEN